MKEQYFLFGKEKPLISNAFIKQDLLLQDGIPNQMVRGKHIVIGKM